MCNGTISPPEILFQATDIIWPLFLIGGACVLHPLGATPGFDPRYRHCKRLLPLSSFFFTGLILYKCLTEDKIATKSSGSANVDKSTHQVSPHRRIIGYQDVQQTPLSTMFRKGYRGYKTFSSNLRHHANARLQPLIAELKQTEQTFPMPLTLRMRAWLSLALADIRIRLAVDLLVIFQYVVTCSYSSVPLTIKVVVSIYMAAWAGLEGLMFVAYGLHGRTGRIGNYICAIAARNGVANTDNNVDKSSESKEPQDEGEKGGKQDQASEWVLLNTNSNIKTTAKSSNASTSTRSTAKPISKGIENDARAAKGLHIFANIIEAIQIWALTLFLFDFHYSFRYNGPRHPWPARSAIDLFQRNGIRGALAKLILFPFGVADHIDQLTTFALRELVYSLEYGRSPYWRISHTVLSAFFGVPAIFIARGSMIFWFAVQIVWLAVPVLVVASIVSPRWRTSIRMWDHQSRPFRVRAGVTSLLAYFVIICFVWVKVERPRRHSWGILHPAPLFGLE